MLREEIKTILPHREPMLLIDESTLEGEFAYSKYTIRDNEFFTTGHFPGYPVVPGVILCEIMAQASFLLIPSEELKVNVPMYGGLDEVKFKQSVFPGDTVCTKTHMITRKGPLLKVDAVSTVGDKVCCKGVLTFILIPKEKIYK